MADAMKAIRQCMEQEAPDELESIERHDFGFVMMAIISPAEPDAIILDIDQPRIGDRHAVRITAEIGQHLLWPAKGRLCIDHPFDTPGIIETLGECGGLSKLCEITEEPQLAVIESRLQILQEQPPKKPREHPHRQEEARLAGDPVAGVEGWAAAGNDAMNVWMMVKVLAPGVEHGHDSDLSTKMLWVGGNGAQRLGGSLEEDVVDLGLVLERDLGHRGRHGEDDMEILQRQQLGLAGREPFRPGPALTLGTMPIAAGIVGAADQSAHGADFRVTTQLCRPAQLDSGHDATLDSPEMSVPGLSISIAVAAEDIRHFQRR